MTKVIADISVSLDGYVTGPNAGLHNGLGDGGEQLHTWVMDGDDVDRVVQQEAADRSGAVVMGRRLFDIVDAPDGWNDEMGYGADLATTPSFVVVTHRAPEEVRLDLDFTFVTDGMASAVERARAKAGDRDVVVMGGGSVIGQCLDLGLLDELHLHVAPIVLGGGTSLFTDQRHELVQTSVRPSSTAIHVTYALT